MVRLCCNFHRNNKYINQFDEINLIRTNETIKDLEKFLINHPKQRINFCVTDVSQFLEYHFPEILNQIQEKRENLYIRLEKNRNTPISIRLQDELKQNNLPFYYTQIVDDWDIFNGICAQGVSDIFIGNNLGFELDKVAAAAHQYNVKVRVYPNLAQSAWNGTPAEKKFFVRPEDCLLYSAYVDCFELFEIPDSSLTRADVLYQIYKLDKKWDGDLSNVIISLKDYINNQTLDDQWGKSRMKCGKNCVKNNRCHICDQLIEMSEKMADKEVMLNKFLTKKIYN